jgi:hypothetical protein
MPYDRIHEAEQPRYYEISPYSVTRIIQGLRDPDAPENNVYTRARGYMLNWLAEGIMMRPGTAVHHARRRAAQPPGRHCRHRADPLR